jgi:hypothetical protein
MTTEIPTETAVQKTPVEYRQEEVAQYQANIDLYTSIEAALPSEWPAHLAHLKGSKNKHSDIAGVEDLNDVLLVSDLWAHDDAVAAIRSETVEMRKAKAILDAIKN